MIKTSLFKFILCFFLWAVIFLYGGYILRGVHYRQDLPRIEQAQAESRVEHSELASELADVIELVNEDLLRIIDQNRAHPVVIPFVEEEEL